MSHTKGKWKISKDGITIGVGSGKTYTQVCRIINPGFSPNNREQADARLIAASPMLLEACKGITKINKDDVFASLWGAGGLMTKVQAAIAQAEKE